MTVRAITAQLSARNPKVRGDDVWDAIEHLGNRLEETAALITVNDNQGLELVISVRLYRLPKEQEDEPEDDEED